LPLTEDVLKSFGALLFPLGRLDEPVIIPKTPLYASLLVANDETGFAVAIGHAVEGFR